MPYYVFKITDGITPLVKNLEIVEEFPSFGKAKKLARELRSSITKSDVMKIKVVFADNTLHAEELLQARREQPILKEWEK